LLYVGSDFINSSMTPPQTNHNIEYNDSNLTITLNDIYIEGDNMELYIESNTTKQSPEDYDAYTIKLSEGNSVTILNFNCEKDKAYGFVNESQIFSYSVDSTDCN